MHNIDLILVTLYVSFMLMLQVNNFAKLYKTAGGSQLQRLSFAATFIVSAQYLRLKNNKQFRRGYMTSLYVVPCVFWLTGMHYCLIANMIFISQGIAYAYIGKLLTYKFSSIVA